MNAPTPPWRLDVLVDLPRASGIDEHLAYGSHNEVPAGSLVRVPLGRRTVLGIVAGCVPWEQPAQDSFELRTVVECLDLPPLAPEWLGLLRFAAAYYQRRVGEVALAALPPDLRTVDGAGLQRRLKRLNKRLGPPGVPSSEPAQSSPPPIALSPEQGATLTAIRAHLPGTHLVHGVTGSGKTEVYLQLAEAALAANQQVLLLVPEINLTPQLEQRLAQRFPGHHLAALHSGLTPAQRLQNWLAAHTGQAQLVVATRMGVFASLPRLGLIVVDEEHDPSYKQQEGGRYSARDLAVYRGRSQGLPVVLGSATPSLETWFNALPESAGGAGRYHCHAMPQRIGQGALPTVRLMDLKRVTEVHGNRVLADCVLAPPLLQAVRDRAAAGEQSLVLLNRRGYAPVLHCPSCGWRSGCPHCSAWRVFHKVDRTLRCHHCGHGSPVPRACPDCGDLDIQPMGRGTERVEEQLAGLLPGLQVARIDADTTRAKGSLERQLAEVHGGQVDVLVGTQMVAKGHDFRRIGLVVAVNADSALFSADFRAPERLFALLMQAAGRAGRDAAQAARSEMWVQTWYPEHPLYASLVAHDYVAFAQQQLAERRAAGLPPYAHLALLRAEARTQEAAHAFLQAAARAGEALPDAPAVLVYPAVPTPVQRVANVERAQMLVESTHRAALQRFLAGWQAALHGLAAATKPRILRWAVDVDPISI